MKGIKKKQNLRRGKGNTAALYSSRWWMGGKYCKCSIVWNISLGARSDKRPFYAGDFQTSPEKQTHFSPSKCPKTTNPSLASAAFAYTRNV